MTADECARINASIDQLGKVINDLKLTTSERLTALETKVSNHRELCPYREDVARFRVLIDDHERRVTDVEDSVDALKLSFAKYLGAGATGGGVVALIGGVVYYVLHAAGVL